MKKLTTLVTILGLLIAFNTNLFAQHHQERTNRKTPPKNQHHDNSKPQHSNPYYSKNKMMVVHHRNIRSVKILPKDHRTIVYRGNNFYFHSGHFYRHVGKRYVVIYPPVGIRFHALPVGFRTIYFGGIPYFYCMGVYYHEVDHEYETIEPQIGTVVPELPEDDVEKVTIDEKTYYKYDNILYKEIATEDGTQYEVAGKLDDN